MIVVIARDPEKWRPIFPATSAKRLRGDHAQTRKGDHILNKVLLAVGRPAQRISASRNRALRMSAVWRFL
jgi:hypothetical protein